MFPLIGQYVDQTGNYHLVFVALGLMPLRLLRAEAENASRELARRRASAPGELPPGQRFCRVWPDPDPGELRARMEAEGASAWADGDVITRQSFRYECDKSKSKPTAK